MLRYTGGNRVGKGTYWNFGTGERLDIETEGILAGASNTVYYRLPAAGILFMGPILGLLYAAFLPFIGIAMAIRVVAQKAGGGVLGTVRSGASFGWRPSESYLSGKGKARKGEGSKDKEENNDEPGKS